MLRLAVLGVFWCVGCAPTLPQLVEHAEHTVRPDGPLIVIGDTQRTHWAERVFMGREQNQTESSALIQQIAHDETPAMVIHLGDLVTHGATAAEWIYFDHLVSPLTARGIPIVPVLGNHDYWGDDDAALSHAIARFPRLRDGTWYRERHRSLGLVWLDSNRPVDAQLDWLRATLADFEENPAVRGILLFVHHPPYTHGEQRRGDDWVASEVVGLLSDKTLALFAGHVHGYERFERGGVQFVTSGGAGGPRVRYNTGRDLLPPAAFRGTERKRAFHYLRLTLGDAGVSVDVRCLKDTCDGGVLERFELPFQVPGT
ncbi:MAG: putative phosphodiesterase [Myxococcota bacterium]|jgi:predicted phosphodiesterase